MKALSLKQPFAELIVSGKKTIELRNWNTKFRGDFFIHASKNTDKEAMKRFGFTNLPQGVIVGKSKLVEVKKYLDEEKYQKDKRKHLANSNLGNFGFVLKDSKRIEPILAKGKLNFWDFKDEM